MVLMGVAPPTYSLVSDDGDESRSAIDLKLGEVTIVGRKDIERSDSKLSKVSAAYLVRNTEITLK